MTQAPFAHLECKLDQGTLVLSLLDSNVSGDELAENLRRELLAASEAHPVPKWVLDFGRVRFFTSAGIRPLLTLHRKLQSSGARLVLCNLREDIAEVFHATRLLATPGSPPGPFEAAADLNEALCRLRHHTSRMESGVLVLTMAHKELRGEELADDLAKEMMNSWQAVQARNVILDFQGVEMVTTPCMRGLLQLRAQVKEKGGQVVLCNLTPQVAEIFSVTRLISSNPAIPSLFQAHPDVASAIKALTSG